VQTAIEKEALGERAELEYRIQRPDGEVRWIWDRAFPIFDDTGTVIRVAGIAADITERKKLEQERDLLANTMSASLNEIYLFDADTLQFVFVNNGALGNLGYTLAEVLQMTPLDLKPQITRDAFQGLISPLFKHEKPAQVFETVHRRADGSLYPVEVHLQLFEQAPRPVFLAVIQDITERKQAEAALHKHSAELEALREIGLELTAELDVDKLLSSIVSRAVELLRGSGGGIYLHRPEQEKLEWVVAKGKEIAPQGQLLGRGEGLSGKVWESGKPILVEDYQHWEGRAAIYEGKSFKAVMGVPILWGGEFMGVLDVLADPPQSFSQQDIALLELIAGYASVAIHNARLFKDAQNRLSQLESLYETSRSFSTEYDLNTQLQSIVNNARKLLNASTSSMYLYIPESDELELSMDTAPFIPIGTRFPVGEGVAGRVANTRQPMRVDDYSAWEGRLPLFEGAPIRAVIEVPMLYQGELIGVLSADEVGDSTRMFTKADEHLLSLFASQAAGAIHSARLHAETLRRAEEFAALYETTRDLATLQGLPALLATIAQRATMLLGIPNASISLYDPVRSDLEIAATIGPDLPIGTRRRLGDGLAGLVAQSREPMIIENYQQWEHRSLQFEGIPYAGMMGVPLLYGGNLLGVLDVSELAPSTRAFNEADTRLLTLFAGQAAAAIENTRLYQAAQQELAERKQVEETLRARDALLRESQRIARLGHYRLDISTGIWESSEILDEVLGIDKGYPTDINGWANLVHPAQREEMVAYFANHVLKEHNVFDREYPIIRNSDGQERWVHGLGRLELDSLGNPLRMIGTIQDITEGKQAEEALHKNEQRLRIALAGMNIAVFNQDTDLRYTWMYQPQLGYTSDQVIGKKDADLLPAQDALGIMEIKRRVVETGKSERAEVPVHFNNQVIYYDLIIEPLLDNKGVILGITGSSLDITEHKRIEMETRRHLAELEALYENGLAVGRLLEPGEIGDRIIETFARYLSWHHVAIRLKRPESDELELIALNQPGLNEQERAEMERHFSSMISKVDQGLSGRVLQTGQAIRTGNVHNLPQYVGTQAGIQSGLYMPLKIGERIIGSISVESEIADAFTAQDERLLATLSNQAAIAFENARLYQSAQQELAERKRLQEQLDREHAQLKALFETIPDPIWLKDPQGKYLACNPVLEELLDTPEERILGKTDYDLFDEELAEDFEGKDREAINRNVPMTYQEWVTYPNKQPRLMETVKTPMHDDKGNLIGVLGISHDITAMHNAQQELRESQELYRLLVETSPDGIGILGLDGTIIFANQQLADLFGMKNPFDCIGTNFLSLIAPEEHPRITDLVEEAMPDRVSLDEYWMVRKDRSRFYGEARSSLSLDKAGQPRWIIGQIRDITESKTAREAIREERQRFLDLFENTPVAIWLEDFSAVAAWMEQLRIQGVTDLKEYLTRNPDRLKQGLELIRILSVNQAAVEMNGAHSKAHLLEKFHDLVREEAPSGVMMDELDSLWKGKTSFEFEMTSRRLDGTLTTGIRHVYIPVNNGKPDYGRVIIASTDISQRVNTEKALQASETHYRELADSITDVFFEMDGDLRYIYWNKSSESLTGITAKDAIGKSMRQIFGESEEQDRIEKIYKDVLRNRQPKTFETSLTLGNHQYVFEINAYPSTHGVSVVAKDVTDRKRSETIMQKRFELMEYSAHHSLNEVMQKAMDEVSQLTGSMIGFMHFVEADGNTLGMQTWSTSALEQFSVSASEGTHLPVDQAGVWADAVRARRSMIHNDYASLPNRKNLPEGHLKIIREMVIPIIRNEKTVAVLGLGNRPKDYTQRDLEIAERFADYAWDITERKQMERALADERNQLAKRVEERAADLIRANTNLARALRVKDEFLANMSHELRTPLNAILGLSESLGEQIAGPLNEKQQKYITTISESGRHLLSLINDILDLAKIEAGQISLDINRVDVQSVCEASLRMIKQLAQNKRQDVTVEIDDDIGLIWADERRLKQMMVNLLSNAVKFTPEDGKIGLEVHGNKNENEVMITVWDNGIGMQEKDLSRLFQPFAQLDSGLARETTGTGLGLALVAQMVRLHGGSVRVNSHPEQGSRFTIVLPWEPALAIDTASKMKVTGKFRALKLDANNRPTILLIEDTDEVIMMIRDYLELAGYQVVTARDGVEGITQAQLIHPDLILMDVMMPRMDGLEATRTLRSDPEFEGTPIIALTALAMPSDRERCIRAGMNDYMSKPVNLKELVKTIQRFLVDTDAETS
jgi:PAS domain S-box-containing protein